MAMKKATPAMLSIEGYRNYRNEPRVELRYMDRTIILTEEQAEQLALAILAETSKFKDDDWVGIEVRNNYGVNFYTYEGEGIDPQTTCLATENELVINNGEEVQFRFPDGSEGYCRLLKKDEYGQVLAFYGMCGTYDHFDLEQLKVRYGAIKRVKDDQ